MKVSRHWIKSLIWGLKYPRTKETPENLVRLYKRKDVDFVKAKLKEIGVEEE